MAKKNKLITIIKGGLGNQLFCYAAARRLAVVNDADLVIDHISGFARDFQYQREFALDYFNIPARKANRRERLEPLSDIRQRARRWRARRQDFYNRRYIEQSSRDFDPRLLDLRFSGTRHLEGYWQSELYFLDIAPIIRDEFRIGLAIDNREKQISRQIAETNSIAVHVRWFDSVANDRSSNAPLQYYERALEHMETQFRQPHYFLFSDRPEDAARLIGYPLDRLTVVNPGGGTVAAISDLRLMSQCKHSIMANSTYSWWGAWLGDAPGRTVITPNISLDGVGAWGFDGLIPDRWLRL